jgi:glycosyltransferase involved in cell wall biosynthesis
MAYPKISIVTPSYNQAEFLEYTIRSVLDQGYPNLEYIVIDGGSTDGSVDIIKKYADRITYWVSEKDNGQYDAINKGFSHSTGEIMGWINSSDIHYPWTFKTIAEIFEQLSEVQWLAGMPTHLSTGNAPQRVATSNPKNIYDILNGNYRWIQQESVFWKRDLWIKAGGQLDIKIKYAEDFNLWLRFFKHTKLYNVNTILAGFRYHDVRRGGDLVNDKYDTEAKTVFKEFKSGIRPKYKRRAFLVKAFSLRKKYPMSLIKKFKIFTWYRHNYIKYNFHLNRWETEAR